MHNFETHYIMKVNKHVIGLNLKDMTHEESLVVPPTGGNSVNWILGHIIVSRNGIAELLGIEKRFSDDTLTGLYDRGTQNIPADKAFKLEKLLDIYNDSQSVLEEKIAATDLSNDHEKLKNLTFLAFHEAYHVGQTGLLRRISGKKGAIK